MHYYKTRFASGERFMNVRHDVTRRPRQAVRNTLSNRHTVGKN